MRKLEFVVRRNIAIVLALTLIAALFIFGSDALAQAAAAADSNPTNLVRFPGYADDPRTGAALAPVQEAVA